MEVKTTKEQIERLQHIAETSTADSWWPDILSDLRTLHTEREREAELERIAGVYHVLSDRDSRFWFPRGPFATIGMKYRDYSLRRECDDVILAAVRQYEQGGGE